MATILRYGLPLVIATTLVAFPGLADTGEQDKAVEQDEQAAGDKSEDQAAQDDEKTESAPKVYTNEDLSRMFGGGAAVPAPDEKPPQPSDPGAEAGAAPEWDPLKAIADQKAAEAERRSAVAEAEKKVIDAEKRVKMLEDRIRKINNPLLARPESPEGQDDWASLSASQRVERSRKELDEAKQALETARAELARLR